MALCTTLSQGLRPVFRGSERPEGPELPKICAAMAPVLPNDASFGVLFVLALKNAIFEPNLVPNVTHRDARTPRVRGTCCACL
mmetsp:Transcript_27893/g.95068  ORF Transcript_27893/g.95068 Transcript_27893/m.95068 type:complete len:83 (+) Transcript_27893:3807-4055(+)